MLKPRHRRTLATVARTLVPPGGPVPAGADEIGLVEALLREVDGYPPRAQRRTKLLLTAAEYMPFATRRFAPLSRLKPEDAQAVLERNGRHPRSALRRLVVSYLKQVTYAAYISLPELEELVGYDYACLAPLTENTSKGPKREHH